MTLNPKVLSIIKCLTFFTVELIIEPSTLNQGLTLQVPTPQNGQRIQIVHWLLPTNCLSVFDHSVGLAIKSLKEH